MCALNSKAATGLELQVKYIHDQEGSAVQENDVASDESVFALRRRRRQFPLQFYRDDINPRSQARWQRPSHLKLPLQSWRQTIAIGKSPRQILSMFVVPDVHELVITIIETPMSAPMSPLAMFFVTALFVTTILIVAVSIVSAIPILIALVVVFIVTATVTVAFAVSQRESSAE